MIPAFLIPVRWYLLYRDSPKQIERNHAVAAGMLGIGILVSQGMFSWTSIFVLGGETLVAGLGGLTNVEALETVSWSVVSIIRVLLSRVCSYFTSYSKN